jgi:hypothetical protein
MLVGPRQAGKSTLAQQLIGEGHEARYLTFDDAGTLAAARGDPTGFIAGLDGPAVLDEIQRAPDLFLAIKAAVDRDRRPGRFLLTGSANVLLLPRVADSLAGRMEVLTLWPLSQGELEGRRERFIDLAFAEGPLPHVSAPAGDDPSEGLLPATLRGGFPEAVARTDDRRREAWFGSYLTTILQRDVRDLSNIDGLSQVPRLLALLAARSASLLNQAELSRSAAMPLSTLRRYLVLLEQTFLVSLLPPLTGGLGRRSVKAPKAMLTDTGLLGSVLGLDRERLARSPALTGPLLETFVAAELRKQAGWSERSVGLWHYRTHAGREVDLVLEDRAGRVVGIEVKASASPTSADFNGLRALQAANPDAFVRGIVLHGGSISVPFGERLHALPIPWLWRMGATES